MAVSSTKRRRKSNNLRQRLLNRRRRSTWLRSSGLTYEQLEDRCLLAVNLLWGGAGTSLSLTENLSGATPTITISEPSQEISLLKIDLGSGQVFASSSTASMSGLTYQNAGSPATSQFATIDISRTNNVSTLQANLPGDKLTLGLIRDLRGGVGRIDASAAPSK